MGKRFNTQFDELNQFMILLMNVIDDTSVMKHHKLCLMILTCRISLIAFHLYYAHNWYNFSTKDNGAIPTDNANILKWVLKVPDSHKGSYPVEQGVTILTSHKIIQFPQFNLPITLLAALHTKTDIYCHVCMYLPRDYIPAWVNSQVTRITP